MDNRMIFDQAVVPRRYTLLESVDEEPVLTSETAIPLADFYELDERRIRMIYDETAEEIEGLDRAS